MDTLSKNCKAVGKTTPQALKLCLLNITTPIKHAYRAEARGTEKETRKASKQATTFHFEQQRTAAVIADVSLGKNY